MRSGLTVHGLWPNYNRSRPDYDPATGDYPRWCGPEGVRVCRDGTTFANYSLNQSQIDPVLTLLRRYWPDEEVFQLAYNTSDLWKHEWVKHGTCSGLDQQSYFEHGLQLASWFGTAPIIKERIGKVISRSQLEDAYDPRAMRRNENENETNQERNMTTLCQAGDSCWVAIDCDLERMDRTDSEQNGMMLQDSVVPGRRENETRSSSHSSQRVSSGYLSGVTTCWRKLPHGHLERSLCPPDVVLRAHPWTCPQDIHIRAFPFDLHVHTKNNK